MNVYESGMLWVVQLNFRIPKLHSFSVACFKLTKENPTGMYPIETLSDHQNRGASVCDYLL